MSSLDSATRELILAYLDGELELDVLRRRFMSIAWALDEESSIDDPITARTSLWLAEYGNGHRTDSEVRGLLADLLATSNVAFGDASVLRLKTGSTVTQTVPLKSLSAVGR
jgi:hypothetical protein